MNQDETIHIPVLMDEVLQWINPTPGMVIVDGTLGGGGHTRAMAERVGNDGLVISMDRDADAIDRATQKLKGLPIAVVQSNFSEIPEVLDEMNIDRVDAVLLDLGLSSDQLADRRRGFSFNADGPLDLRFDTERGEPAWQMLARLREENIANLIYEYGEEKFSRRIAKKIVERRRESPVRTAAELAELVRSCIPRSRTSDRIDPATRTFQALRIAVNGELKSLEIALRRIPDRLTEGGRLAIISFHSLEDRRVKNAFREDERLEVLTRKPIVPGDREEMENPRSRSSKMRVAKKIGR